MPLRILVAIVAVVAVFGLFLGISDRDWLTIACSVFALILIASIAYDGRDT